MKKRKFSNKNITAALLLFFIIALVKVNAQQYVYWTEYTYGTNNSKIGSVKTDGTDYSAITITDNTFPQGLAIYSPDLYWSELLPSNVNINRSFWSPMNIMQVIGSLSGVRSIAIDDINSKIYWTSSVANDNKISRANIDGTGIEILKSFGAGNNNIRQIAIDVPGNKMYWADFSAGKICKANLDGTSPVDLVTGGTGKGFTGVAVDPVNSRIYWTEINQNQINSIKADGTGGITSGLTTGLDRPQYMTYYGGKIYWGEASNAAQNIKCADVNSSGTISGVNSLHTANNPGGIIVGSAPSLLPVELVSFSAKAVENGIELNWKTATEVNNYGFQIERQVSNKQSAVGSENNPQSPSANPEWTKVGFVPGSGNSNSVKEYSFFDNNPAGGLLQYRIKQIDNDGNYKYYSKTTEINFVTTGVQEKQIPNDFSLKQNYPNPFNPSTSIQYAVSSTQLVTLKVYDVLGNEVASLVNEFKSPGNYEVKFNASNFSTGVYFYKLSAGNFTAVKKLVLMK